MLQLQIKELCILRGIKVPQRAMMKAGISQNVASAYLTGKRKHLLFKDVEILCTLLRCIPSDLFAWTPDDKNADYPENPLQKIRKQSLPDLQKVIGGLSLEEVRRRLEGE
ncbi:MAG TPA: helix-turn-helix transcriptional regulator [Bacteroidia bacterium]|nr:helix-turn-helix transcriptional regulator [Bacteroidia bacterium]